MADDAKLDQLIINDNSSFGFVTAGSEVGHVFSEHVSISRQALVNMRLGYALAFSGAVSISGKVDGISLTRAELAAEELRTKASADEEFAKIMKQEIDRYRTLEKGVDTPQACVQMAFSPTSGSTPVSAGGSGRFQAQLDLKSGSGSPTGTWKLVSQRGAVFSPVTSSGHQTTFRYSVPSNTSATQIVASLNATSKAGVATGDWTQPIKMTGLYLRIVGYTRSEQSSTTDGQMTISATLAGGQPGSVTAVPACTSPASCLADVELNANVTSTESGYVTGKPAPTNCPNGRFDFAPTSFPNTPGRRHASRGSCEEHPLASDRQSPGLTRAGCRSTERMVAALRRRQMLGLAALFAAAVGAGSADAQLPPLGGPEDAALRAVTAQRSHLTAAIVSFDGRTRLGRAARRLVPLASTMKVLILDEAAHEIAAGRLRADVPIALHTIALTYLPGTDDGAHAHAVAAARRRGWVQHQAVSFRHVLDAMIEFSDNAASDTALRMIDTAALARRARALGQDVPLPPGGLFISWGVGVRRLQHATRGAAYDGAVQRLALRLARDSRFRQRVLSGLRAGVLPPNADVVRLAAQLAPRGSAAAYAELMRRILTGRGAADRLSASVLGWPLRATPALRPSFPLIAQKGGDLPGILTVVEGMTRRGQVGFVTALFFSGLDLDVQARLEREDALDLVPLGIASRRAFRLRARQALGLASAGVTPMASLGRPET